MEFCEEHKGIYSSPLQGLLLGGTCSQGVALAWNRVAPLGRGGSGLRGAGGEGFVESAETAGHAAGEVEQNDGVLVGHLLVEMVERGGFDLDGPDRRERADGGDAPHGFNNAHFAEESALIESGQHEGVRGVGVLDDFNITFDEDKEGVALVAFAHDPCAEREVMHETFVRKQGQRWEVDSRQDGDGTEGFEERGSGGNHLQRQ